jgi:hypothetical protein
MASRRRVGRLVTTAAFACLCTWTPAAQSPDRLVWADFETVADDGRPLSARGGHMQLFGYSENPTRPPVFTGAPGIDPPAPALVRIKADDPNRLGKVDFELLTPNRWSGVTLEIKGQADQDGRTPRDDVSGYKTLSMQVYATGVATVRVEVLSRGWEQDTHTANPQITFLPKPGLNTYRVELKKFAQPAWVTDTRIDPKEVLKNLTAVTISAYCEECRPTKGMLVVDNIVFEK